MIIDIIEYVSKLTNVCDGKKIYDVLHYLKVLMDHKAYE